MVLAQPQVVVEAPSLLFIVVMNVQGGLGWVSMM